MLIPKTDAPSLACRRPLSNTTFVSFEPPGQCTNCRSRHRLSPEKRIGTVIDVMSRELGFVFSGRASVFLRRNCLNASPRVIFHPQLNSWRWLRSAIPTSQTRTVKIYCSSNLHASGQRPTEDAAREFTRTDSSVADPVKKSARSPPSGFESEHIAFVTLKGGKSRLFREHGSCVVYAGAIAHVRPKIGTRRISPAERVAVVNGSGDLIGFGFYNPFSMFAVRIVQFIVPSSGSNHNPIEECTSDASSTFNVKEAIRNQIRHAFAVRQSLGLPSNSTDAFRAVNGEGDKLSGLAVDVYANTAVILSGALWVERHRVDIEDAVKLSFAEARGQGDTITIWRRSMDRLRQDGLEEATKETTEENLFSASLANAEQTEIDADASFEQSLKDGTVIKENDIKYVIPQSAMCVGQKSGFYADQSDQRCKIRQIVQRRPGVSVLDCYCYSGGFAISAALGGAGSVTAVDTSSFGIAMGRQNAIMNGVSDNITWIEEDASLFMKKAATEGKSYDIVILDPPKLAPSAKSAVLQRAVSKYRQINANALRIVKPGGLLLTCTCSAAMTKDRNLFVATICQAAEVAKRSISLLQVSGAAADHPVELSDIHGPGYLTACLIGVR